MKDRKGNSEQQPRHKNPSERLSPREFVIDTTRFIGEQKALYERAIKEDPELSNPTSDALGKYKNGLTPAQEELVQGDLLGWGALDEILLAIIRSHPVPGVSDEKRLLSNKERLRQARISLLGLPKKGRVAADDTEMLLTITAMLLGIEPRDEDHDEERDSFARVVKEAIGEEQWEEFDEFKRDKTLKRLRRKYVGQKDMLIATTKGYNHPAQQKRWALVQSVIRLLRELQILEKKKV